MALTITGDQHDIIHVSADTQKELCHAFVRLQEFYESPLPKLRGHHFTIAEFEASYQGDFYSEWHGFNLPGEVVRKFEACFCDTSDAEKAILEAAKGLPRFYVIGTHKGSETDPEDDVLAHERAHARYYLDKSYRKAVGQALTVLRETHPTTVESLQHWLVNRGYSFDVLDDEINAYLATTSQKWWAAKIDEATAIVLYQIGEPFRYLLQQEAK